MTFDELERRYDELKGRHVAGLLSDEALRVAVSKLRLQDAQGRTWTMGARSGRWYVYQGGAWVEADPPQPAATLVSSPCSQCGAPLAEEAAFCGSCGAPVVHAVPPSSASSSGGLSRGVIIWGIVAVGLALLSCLALVVYGVVAPGRPLVRLISGSVTGTPTAQPVCTPPACGPDEAYHCPDACPGGCGVVCATFTPGPMVEEPIATPSATPTLAQPVCTPPACGPDDVFYCPDECPGGCGIVCATRVPSATPTHTPASTKSPVSAMASATPCAKAAWGWFDGALRFSPGVREKIGCPVGDAQAVAAASQDFERGTMVWREDEQLIYVFFDGDRWEVYVDAWREGMPEQDPAYGLAPEGLIQPRRGFGLIWQEHTSVRDRLGWALNEERLCDEAHVQPFERGLMLSCADDVVPKSRIRVFVLFDDFTYTIYLPT